MDNKIEVARQGNQSFPGKWNDYSEFEKFHFKTVKIQREDYSENKKKIRRLFMLFGVFAVIVAMSFLLMHFPVTGKTILLDKNQFSTNDVISGAFSIPLKEGELIPADSVVSIKTGSIQQSSTLSQLLNIPTQQGEFFFDGNSLGSGTGYGFPGKSVVYPEISFRLKLTSLSISEGDPSVSPDQEIEGRANHDNPFEQSVDGEAELVSGSVFDNEVSLPDNAVSVSMQDGKVIVTTDYSKETTGFGKDFLGANQTLNIDLSKFGLQLPDGNNSIEMSLSYQNQSLFLSSASVSVSSPSSSSPLPANLTSSPAISSEPQIADEPLQIQDTATFSYTGSQQTWVVPTGVTSITVDAKGAAGYLTGGKGGRVQATLSVSPGQTLYIYVGGVGYTHSGYNGGGAVTDCPAPQGGGASDIRSGGTALSDRILVAGGGGGGTSCSSSGGDGGNPATNGAGYYSNDAMGGFGATISAAGAGGYGSYKSGNSGSLGSGGTAASADGGSDCNDCNIAGDGGGTGGGGYYGGGSGGIANDGYYSQGAGGGGSSYVISGTGITYTTGYQSGDGQIIMTYTASSGGSQNISGSQNLDQANTVYLLNSTAKNDSTAFTILANNVTLDCQGNMINYSQSIGASSINLSVYNSTTIKNCVIVQGNGSTSGDAIISDSNAQIYGLTLSNINITTFGSNSRGVNIQKGFSNSMISGCNITTSGGNSNDILIQGSASTNITIINNFFKTSAGPGINSAVTIQIANISYNSIFSAGSALNFQSGINNASIFYNNATNNFNLQNSKFNVISGNIINMTLAANMISLNPGNSNNNNVTYNILLNSNTTANYRGIVVNGSNNNIMHNLINLTGAASPVTFGMGTNAPVINMTVFNNTVQIGSTGAAAFQINSGVTSSNYTYNNIILPGAGSTGFLITSANSILLDSNVIMAQGSYMSATSSSGNMTNNTFYNSFGSFRSLAMVNFSTMNISTLRLNMSLNSTFLNSSASVSFLNNTPTELTMYGINWTIPRMLFSSDDSTYVICNATTSVSQCYNVSYNTTTSTFVFNVTHFTSYSTDEGAADTTPPSVSFITPTTGFTNTIIDFNATVTDSGSGVNSCHLFVVEAGGDQGLMTNIGNNVYNKTIDTTGVPAGVYHLFANCTDNAGNRNDTSLTSVTLQDRITSENISSCRELNQSNFTYYLNQSVENTNTCFDITANNVTLDCQGNSINVTNLTLAFPDFNAPVYINAPNSTVRNCTIYSNGGFGMFGIIVNDYGNKILGNAISSIGSDTSGGIVVIQFGSDPAINNRIENNTVIITSTLPEGGSASFVNPSGILITPGFGTNANYNILNNNLVYGAGFGVSGVVVSSANGTLLSSNKITTNGNASSAIFMDADSGNNTFSDSIVSAEDSYISSCSSCYDDNMINTTFLAENGSVRYPQSIKISLNANVTVGRFNIAFNRTFLNSSNSGVSFLNASAELTMFNLPWDTPQILADENDHGNFVPCNTPTCNIIDYAPPALSGIVSLWHGEGNANDSVGGNDGSISGGVTFAQGKFGQAFSFDGQGSDINAGPAGNLNFKTGDNFTFTAWIYVRGVGNDNSGGTILGKFDNPATRVGYFFYYYNSSLGLYWQNNDIYDDPANFSFPSNHQLTLNEWHHVAYVRNEGDGFQRIYADGALVATKPLAILNSSNSDFFIGAYSPSAQTFNGSIDDIQVYHRALSPSEIAQLNSTRTLVFNVSHFTTFATREFTVAPTSGNISSCQDLNETGFTYSLNSSITHSGTCFNVLAENVTLDCLGNNVTGDGSTGTGITSSGFNNTVVENCNISGFHRGIEIGNGSYNNLTNNKIGPNAQYGLVLTSNHHDLISENNLSSQYSGMLIVSSDDNSFIENTVNSNSAEGVNIQGSANDRFINNTFSYNPYGLITQSCSNIFLVGNIFRNATLYGLYIDSSLSNTVYNNFFNNTNNVILVSSSADFNTTLSSGTNIINGSLIGGNLWANYSGSGFSETCTDSDSNGICDSPFSFSGGADYLPISAPKVGLECGINISDNTVLPSDMHCDEINISLSGSDVISGGAALSINASNVILDCNGHSIIGNGNGTGIFSNTGINNVTIKNCSIVNYEIGTYLKSVYNSTLIDNQIINTTNYFGIWIFTGFNNSMLDNTVYNTILHDGVLIENSPFTLISGNTINQSAEHAMIIADTFDNSPSSCGNNTIFNNTFTNSGNAGVIISHPGNVQRNCDHNNISQNTFTNNAQGVYFDQVGSNFNIVDRNIMEGNGYGMIMTSSNYNNITNNVIENSTVIGIEVSAIFQDNRYNPSTTFSQFNLIVNNTILLASEGITLFKNANQNEISNNTLADINIGVDFATGASNNFYNNFVINDTYGVLLGFEGFNCIPGPCNNQYAASNKIYNNFFNVTNVILEQSILNNYWNTTLTTGPNIVNGTNIGGNFYSNPEGTGFSETCNFTGIQGSGICDSAYIIDSHNTDYLPLSANLTFIALPITIISPQSNSVLDSRNITVNFSINFENANHTVVSLTQNVPSAESNYFWATATAGDTITKLDKNNNVIANVSIGGATAGIATDDAHIWVSSETPRGSFTGKVVKIDKVNNSISDIINIGYAASGIAVDDQYVWACRQNSEHVIKIDKLTDQIIGSINSGSGGAGSPMGIAVDNESLWVTNNAGNSGFGTVVRIDKKTGNILNTWSVSHAAQGIIMDDNYVWVTDGTSNNVVKINKITNATTNIPMDSPVGIAVDSDSVWVSNYNIGKVTRVNKTNDNIITTITVGAHPTGISLDNDYVWSFNNGDGSISRINKTNTSVVSLVNLGTVGVTFGDSTGFSYDQFFGNHSSTVASVSTNQTGNTSLNLIAPYDGVFNISATIFNTTGGYASASVGNITVSTSLSQLTQSLSTCVRMTSSISLTQDNYSCFVVNSSNLVLDCQGNSIIGDGKDFGVYDDGTFNNFTIKNCFVRDFVGADINLYGINNSILGNHIMNSFDGIISGGNTNITGNTFENNSNAGMLTGNEATIISNLAINNQYGIYAGTNSIIINNNATNNNYGILGYGNVTGNTAVNNTYFGIFIGDGFAYNNIVQGGSNGFYVLGNATLVNNLADSNNNGFYLASFENNLTDNFVNNANSSGIYLANNNNSIYRNSINNSYNGIFVANGGHDEDINTNFITNFTNIGIYFNGTNNYNFVENNRIIGPQIVQFGTIGISFDIFNANNTVNNNYVYGFSNNALIDSGISFGGTGNTLSGNIINNTRVGISIGGGTDIAFYNTYMDSAPAFVNARGTFVNVTFTNTTLIEHGGGDLQSISTGMITFQGKFTLPTNITLQQGAIIDQNSVYMNNQEVQILTSSSCPVNTNFLNMPAKLAFFNENNSFNNRVYVDTEDTGRIFSECNSFTDPSCNNLNLIGASTLVFDVSNFTTYSWLNLSIPDVVPVGFNGNFSLNTGATYNAPNPLTSQGSSCRSISLSSGSIYASGITQPGYFCQNNPIIVKYDQNGNVISNTTIISSNPANPVNDLVIGASGSVYTHGESQTIYKLTSSLSLLGARELQNTEGIFGFFGAMAVDGNETTMYILGGGGPMNASIRSTDISSFTSSSAILPIKDSVMINDTSYNGGENILYDNSTDSVYSAVSNVNGSAVIVLKYSPNLTLMANATFQIPGFKLQPNSIKVNQQTSDVYVSAGSGDFNLPSFENTTVLRFNSSLSLQASRTLSSSYEYMTIGSDGYVYLTGSTIYRLNPDNFDTFSCTDQSDIYGFKTPTAIAAENSNNVYLCGDLAPQAGAFRVTKRDLSQNICARESIGATCGITYNTPNSVNVLTNDVTATTQDCFTIDAVNVTLDCNGSKITLSDTNSVKAVNIRADNATVKNCVIVGGTAPADNVISSKSSGGTIYNNKITVGNLSPGQATSGIAVGADGADVSGNNVSQNIVNVTGNDSNYGIFVFVNPGSGLTNYGNHVENNIVNIVNTLAEGASPSILPSAGIAVALGANNNLISNNTVTSEGYLDNGIFIVGSNNTIVSSNTVAAKGNSSSALAFSDLQVFGVPGSGNNTLLNNVLSSGKSGYILSCSDCSDNSMTNTTFLDDQGSSRYTQEIGIPTTANVTTDKLNISSNRIYLNSSDSAVSFLNASAELTMFNLVGEAQQILVAFNDSDFESCSDFPNLCNQVSFNSSSGTLVFNVSHFTTYITNGTADTTPPSVSQIAPMTAVVDTVINFNATVIDLGSGVNSCNLFVVEAGGDQGLMTNLAGDVYNKTINTTGIPAGVYHLFANCTDNAGNRNDTSLTSVTLQNAVYANISGCQNLDQENTTYYLNATANNDSTCFKVLANNVTLDCGGNIINYSQASGGSAIFLNSSNDTTIRGCNIFQGNGGTSGDAILSEANTQIYRLNLLNSNITTYGSSSRGMNLQAGLFDSVISGCNMSTAGAASNDIFIQVSGSNITIYGNQFKTSGSNVPGITSGVNILKTNMSYNSFSTTGSALSFGSGFNNGLITYNNATSNFNLPNSKHNLISGNMINMTTGTQLIFLNPGNSNNNTVTYNTLLSSATSGQIRGIVVNGSNNVIMHNLINLTGSNSQATFGIGTNAPVTNMTVFNNTIQIASANASGFQLNTNAVSNSNYTYNTIILPGVATTGFLVSGATSILYDSNIISAQGAYIAANSASSGNITNNTFYDSFGSFRSLAFINVSGMNITTDRLNISFNRTYLNSSNPGVSFLNNSAELTMFNLPWAVPQMLVDVNDTGSFSVCNSTTDPACYNVSYLGNTLVFNVTHFTTYSTRETPRAEDTNISFCPRTLSQANTVYTLNTSINSSGTCLTVNANNITINCAGQTINFSQSSTGDGINITSNFATIKNCVIVTSGSPASSFGIQLNPSSNDYILNNSVQILSATGTATRAIRLEAGSNNNILTNNSLITTGSNIVGIISVGSFNNTFSYNNINTTGSTSNGIAMVGSSGNFSIIGNVIYTTGSTSPGMSFNANSSGFNVTNNLISVNGTASNSISIASTSPNQLSTSNVFSSNILYSVISCINVQPTSTGNKFYNNFLNCSGAEVSFTGSGTIAANDWNTTLQGGTNIVNGANIGGNYYANSSGTGFSETCTDSDSNGICDSSYTLNTSNIDYLPLSSQTSVTMNISSCQTLNLTNGIYLLNFTANSSKTCFNINASHVTLNCQGNIINYSQSAAAGVAYGVNITGSNALVENCVIFQSNTNPIAGSHAVQLDTNVFGATVLNNSIKTVGNTARAINFNGGNTNISVIGNSLEVSGGAGADCIRILGSLGSSYSNNISSNLFTVRGASSAIHLGIGTGTGAQNISLNSIYNNTLLVIGNGADGLSIGSTSTAAAIHDNIFKDNSINVTGAGIGIRIFNLAPTGVIINNSFINTAIYSNNSNASYIVSGLSGNNMTNTTLLSDNGSVRYPQNVNVSGNANISSDRFSISFNRTYLNSSNGNVSFLNTSAELTMYGINFTNPQILVASDDVTFSLCNSTSTFAKCYNVSYNQTTQTFVFNVSHFTTYATRETPTNSAPVIESVTINSTQTPAEGTFNSINLSFVAFDSNGASDINTSSAKANFTDGITLRKGSCVNISTIDSNRINFSCSVDMWYFDSPGVWNVSTFVQDFEGLSGQNDSQNFSLNSLVAFRISPESISWKALNAFQNNVTADNFTTINNTGNVNLGINLTATDLIGNNTPTVFSAGNFTASNNSGTLSCSGNSLINGTNVAISGLNVLPGNLSAGQAQGFLYYCVPQVPPFLPRQRYSTINPWMIEASALAALITLKRKRKKELVDELNLELKEQYGIGLDEVIEFVKAGKKKIIAEKAEEVPISIFTSNMGPAECVIKYFKENRKMRFSEIAKMLNRNDRTIWKEYDLSLKSEEKLNVKESLSIPASIFSDRKFSILESLTIYLKRKGISNSEIARMLERDQRNIHTIYSRAKEKMKV